MASTGEFFFCIRSEPELKNIWQPNIWHVQREIRTRVYVYIYIHVVIIIHLPSDSREEYRGIYTDNTGNGARKKRGRDVC